MPQKTHLKSCLNAKVICMIHAEPVQNYHPSIVVVDDHSPDGTGAAVKLVAAQYGERHVTLLERSEKLGYGSAFVMGFREALERAADVIVSMDADYSHDPQAIPSLIEKLKECDMVIGSRYIGGIRILNWNMKRLILSNFANAYVNMILRFGIKDCTSGFRAYKADVLRSLDISSASSQGYAFIVEMLEFARRQGYVVKEAPIIYTERRIGQSKMSKKVMFEAMIRPLSLKWDRIMGGKRHD